MLGYGCFPLGKSIEKYHEISSIFHFMVYGSICVKLVYRGIMPLAKVLKYFDTISFHEILISTQIEL